MEESLSNNLTHLQKSINDLKNVNELIKIGKDVLNIHFPDFKRIEVLVELDKEVNHYIVEGVNVDYLSCYGKTVTLAVESFYQTFLVTIAKNFQLFGVEKVATLLKYNIDPQLNYFDDGASKVFIQL